MLNYKNFISINEANNNNVILYRGDSQYISDVNPDKFESKSIYGLGLYLTDNYDVAYSYTLKNSQDDAIITKLYPGTYDDLDNKLALKLAKLNFIIMYLLNKINNTNFDKTELYNIYDTLKSYIIYGEDLINRYKKGIELFWLSDKYIKELESEPEKYKYQLSFAENEIKKIKKRIKEIENIHIKYDKYIKKATEYFNKHESDYNFINNGEDWNVVDIKMNKGHISEYEVSKNIIDSLYNANIIIPDNVLSILKRMIIRYKNSDKIKKYLNEHKFINSDRFNYKNIVLYSTHNGNYPLTLSNFLYEFSDFRTGETALDKNDWTFFINEMKKLGYKGIIYNGGEHLNSPIKHNAYVIWNLLDVKRIK